jgi:hypothetical protein
MRATAVDTSLLQAFDSFLQYHVADCVNGELHAIDPRNREQFIEAVDAYVDSGPALYLPLPKSNLGHLAPAGAAIAAEAEYLPDGIEKSEMPMDVGRSLYRDFLNNIHPDAPGGGEFRTLAVQWGWFQVRDVDVLLGYASRMAVKDLFISEAMRDDFEATCSALGKQRVHEITRAARDTQPYTLRTLANFAKAITRSSLDPEPREQTGQVAQRLLDEAKSYKLLAKKLDLEPELGAQLFVLAYAGSVFRRGWEYTELISRKSALPDCVYLAHHLRSQLLPRCEATQRVQAEWNVQPTRVYWWSWGATLALAIEHFPQRWPLARVIGTIEKIRAQRLSISIDDPEPKELLERVIAKVSTMYEVLKECELVCAEEVEMDRIIKATASMVRMVPIITAATALSMLLDGHKLAKLLIVPPGVVGLWQVLATGIAGARYNRLCERTGQYLAERYLLVRNASVRREVFHKGPDGDLQLPIPVRLQWDTATRHHLLS